MHEIDTCFTSRKNRQIYLAVFFIFQLRKIIYHDYVYVRFQLSNAYEYESI